MNTYLQAAKKFGVSVATLNRMIKRRLVAVVQLSPRCCRITDEEISRVIQKRTRRAI